MLLIGIIGLLGAAASAYPQVEVISTDAVSRSGRRFIIRRNVVPKVKRANQVIPVVVGGPQDTYVPNVVTAAVGDVVQFQFSNGNHTVTQSAADQGCTPLQATVPTAVHSGHIPFQDGNQEVGTFNLVVSSTDPMFLYCATGPHCQEGQVMVVNPQNVNQVVDYAKVSQATTKSTDGTTVVGGAVGKIALGNAAFVPAPAQQGGAAPPGAPPAGAAPPAEGAAAAPPAASAPPAGAAPPAEAAAPPAEAAPPAAAPPAEAAPAASAPPAEAALPGAAPAEAAPATPA